MTSRLTIAVLIVSILNGSQALAEGELQIFNYGSYTSPDLIKKFEAAYKIKVTITDYDSNDTALAKVKAGGHGFDIVVPSASFVPIWIGEGLVEETRPDLMENFKHVDPKWVDVPFDKGRRYSVPWQWGTTGVIVNRKVYAGDPNSSAIFLDPPDALKGKINVLPEMADVMHLAIKYVGGEPCTGDKAVLSKVRDTLQAAKRHWLSINFGVADRYVGGDLAAGMNWSGAAFRVRLRDPDFVYGYPKEGFPIWMDNVMVLKGAKNLENAKLFQNFIMDPQNAAMISAFARYANGIKGSEAYMPKDMKTAPEMNIPPAFASKAQFALACPPEVNKLYAEIWTELLK